MSVVHFLEFLREKKFGEAIEKAKVDSPFYGGGGGGGGGNGEGNGGGGNGAIGGEQADEGLFDMEEDKREQ